MARSPTPTLRRRELGARLRQLRQDANLTADDVANRLMVSATKITRLETGARGVSLRDVRDLCALYQLGEEEQERLMSLARQSQERSWWQRFDLPYSTYVGLETAATSIADFKSDVVPGLLQTQRYARAIIEVTIPDPSPERVAAQVESRGERQRLLSDEPPVGFWAVIGEGALRTLVGGPQTMREQLDVLVERAAQPTIDLQLLPFGAGAHPAVNSTFTILHFEEDVRDVVYVEGLMGDHYLESPTDIVRYGRVFDQLRAMALSPKDSVAQFAAIAKSFADE